METKGIEVTKIPQIPQSNKIPDTLADGLKKR